jgi:hypothetical protein
VFITNELEPHELVAEFLRWRTFSEAQTSWLKARTHDRLCEDLARKIEVILDFYITYNVDLSVQQGPRDSGVDVLFSIQHKSSHHRIGFQIKSNDEAVANSKRPKGSPSIAKDLKASYGEACANLGVNDYYVMLGFDEKTHRKLVYSINAELANFGAPGRTLKVVTPRHFMALLRMDDETIHARCARLLCEDDGILRAASIEATELTEKERNFVLATIFRSLEGDGRIYDPSAAVALVIDDEEPQEDTRDNDENHIEDDDDDAEPQTDAGAINALEEAGYLSSEGEGWVTRPSMFPAICAMYFEARTRHKMVPSQAAAYVRRVLREA